MAKAKLKVLDDGPYELTGSFKIVDMEGNTFETESSVSLCRCGYSEDKPFCDGTHDNINFENIARAQTDKLIVEV